MQTRTSQVPAGRNIGNNSDHVRNKKSRRDGTAWMIGIPIPVTSRWDSQRLKALFFLPILRPSGTFNVFNPLFFLPIFRPAGTFNPIFPLLDMVSLRDFRFSYRCFATNISCRWHFRLTCFAVSNNIKGHETASTKTLKNTNSYL